MTGATMDLVRQIDAKVRALGEYREDPAGKDKWQSCAADVEAGRPFKGDCDEWAETAVELLFRAGVSHYQLFRCIVSTPGQVNDHMIGLVHLDDGTFCSVGDCNAPPAAVRGDAVHDYLINQVSRLGEMDENGKPRWRRWEEAP